MAVVMSGSFAFLLNQYNRVQRSVEMVTADLTQPVAREGSDRGAFTRVENGPGNNSKPLFVVTDRSDANNPVYKIVDESGQAPLPIEDLDRDGVLDAGEDINGNGQIDRDQYLVDTNGNILFTPTSLTGIPGSWYTGNFVGTSRTAPFTSDSYMWHPYKTINEDANANGVLDVGEDLNRNGLLDDSDEQVYFGRSFVLDKVEPKEGSTVRGGTVFICADDNARVWVNGTFVGECYGFNTPTEIVIPASLLKVGENVLTVQASNRQIAPPAGFPPTPPTPMGYNPAGVSVVADFGGIDGKGAGFGGVTLTSRRGEIERWSTSYRNASGLLGKVQFDIRQGSALTTRTDQLTRMQGVLSSLSGLLGATIDQDETKFRALR